MKKYFVKLKSGDSSTLVNMLIKHIAFSKEDAILNITRGSVWVDNKRETNPDRIITTELVAVYKPDFPVGRFVLDPASIVFEDNDLMVVHKSSGLDTVPTPMCATDNLLYGVGVYLRSKGYQYEISPINRLDKPTQGLTIFAKNKKTEIALHELFRLRKIKKLYLAVTPQIEMKSNEMIIDEPVEWKGKVQEAVTHIKFIKHHNSKSYFRVYPLTGRFHQIRKHFKNHVTPIIGDALYGGYSRKDKMELICFYYKFKHPMTGKVLEIEYLEDTYRC